MAAFPVDPIQPFWVLNSDKYYKKTSKIPAIAHFYKFQGQSGITTSYAVPDGAIDIIIECGPDDVNARICGPVGSSSLSGFEENRTYFGIRMRTEALDHIGDASISDLVGQEYSLKDMVQNTDFLEEISLENDFARQASIFEQRFLHSDSSIRGNDNAHDLTLQILEKIYRSNGQIKVQELQELLHYSRRHLTRCFVQTMGMDIKSFSSYVRFQYILHGIRDGVFQSASDAAMAGNYYDQSHFQKAFRNFTHTTPCAMIRLFRENDYTKRIVLYS